METLPLKNHIFGRSVKNCCSYCALSVNILLGRAKPLELSSDSVTWNSRSGPVSYPARLSVPFWQTLDFSLRIKL